MDIGRCYYLTIQYCYTFLFGRIILKNVLNVIEELLTFGTFDIGHKLIELFSGRTGRTGFLMVFGPKLRLKMSG